MPIVKRYGCGLEQAMHIETSHQASTKPDPVLSMLAENLTTAQFGIGQAPFPVATNGFSGWCPDEDTRHNVRARRNVLLALWAGKLMGFSADRLSAYAVDVHLADFKAVGDSDVVAKVTTDLQRAGLSLEQADVTFLLGAFHRDALVQTNVTD